MLDKKPLLFEVVVLLLGALLLSLAWSQTSGGESGGGQSAATATAAQPAGSETGGAGGVVFQDPLDNSPLEVPLPEDDTLTEAVAQFHKTGENIYDGDADALAAGKKLYAQWCQACHLTDGSGRIGPSFIDDRYNYPRTDTAVGKFEMVWAGGTGAMQSFADRLSQDQILEIIAHINSLRP